MEKIYIGQSVNIKKRLYKYTILDCKHQRKLYNSLLKYGSENHLFEIIEECDKLELNNKELFYQKQFKVVENGLNCFYTTDENGYREVSIETRIKISNSNKGRIFTEEHKNNLSLAHKGKIISDEQKN